MVYVKTSWLKRSAVLGLAALATMLLGCPGTSDSYPGASLGAISVDGFQAGTNTCQIPPNVDQLADRLLTLVNRERTSRGLTALRRNPLLDSIAESFACQLIEDDFFEHHHPETGDGPGQRAINGGYIFLAIGENLAAGQPTPDKVVDDWMASTDGHRENILTTAWQEAGVGIRTGGDFGVYWVMEYANPP